MAIKCNCGHVHCCCNEAEERVINAVDDYNRPIYGDNGQRQFVRKTCKECHKQLGDHPM